MIDTIVIPKDAWCKRVPREHQWWELWKRDKWELVEEWWIQIDGEWWCVLKGFQWDGSTIPRLLWILFPPSFAPAFHAALFHDICYLRWHKYVTKAWADEALRKIMIHEGAATFVARSFWLGVRANITGGGW